MQTDARRAAEARLGAGLAVVAGRALGELRAGLARLAVAGAVAGADVPVFAGGSGVEIAMGAADARGAGVDGAAVGIVAVAVDLAHAGADSLARKVAEGVRPDDEGLAAGFTGAGEATVGQPLPASHQVGEGLVAEIVACRVDTQQRGLAGELAAEHEVASDRHDVAGEGRAGVGPKDLVPLQVAVAIHAARPDQLHRRARHGLALVARDQDAARSRAAAADLQLVRARRDVLPLRGAARVHARQHAVHDGSVGRWVLQGRLAADDEAAIGHHVDARGRVSVAKTLAVVGQHLVFGVAAGAGLDAVDGELALGVGVADLEVRAEREQVQPVAGDGQRGGNRRQCAELDLRRLAGAAESADRRLLAVGDRIGGADALTLLTVDLAVVVAVGCADEPRHVRDVGEDRGGPVEHRARFDREVPVRLVGAAEGDVVLLGVAAVDDLVPGIGGAERPGLGEAVGVDRVVLVEDGEVVLQADAPLADAGKGPVVVDCQRPEAADLVVAALELALVETGLATAAPMDGVGVAPRGQAVVDADALGGAGAEDRAWTASVAASAALCLGRVGTGAGLGVAAGVGQAGVLVGAGLAQRRLGDALARAARLLHGAEVVVGAVRFGLGEANA